MLTFAFGVFCGWLMTTILYAWLQHIDHEERMREFNRSVDARPDRDWQEVPPVVMQNWIEWRREHLK